MVLSYEDWEHLTAAIENVATAVALIGGAFWAYFRFWRQREGHGRVDLTADLAFVGRRGDQWIVEVIARLENKGLVRHWLDQLTFSTRYLLDGDALEFGEKQINYQLKFPHRGPSGRLFPEDWNGSFVESEWAKRKLMFSCDNAGALIERQPTAAIAAA